MAYLYYRILVHVLALNVLCYNGHDTNEYSEQFEPTLPDTFKRIIEYIHILGNFEFDSPNENSANKLLGLILELKNFSRHFCWGLESVNLTKANVVQLFNGFQNIISGNQPIQWRNLLGNFIKNTNTSNFAESSLIVSLVEDIVKELTLGEEKVRLIIAEVDKKIKTEVILCINAINNGSIEALQSCDLIASFHKFYSASLSHVIEKAYKIEKNFKNVDNFIWNAFGIETDPSPFYNSYVTLLKIMSVNDYKYGDSLLTIVYRIKDFIHHNPYVSSIWPKDIKLLMPQNLNFITFNEVCLKNSFFKENLYSPNDNYSYDENYRNIFSGINRPIREMRWKLEIPESKTRVGLRFEIQDGNRRGFFIKNTRNGEYLCVSNVKYNDRRRMVLTQRLSYANNYPNSKLFLWRVRLVGKSEIELFNVEYEEILYASRIGFQGKRLTFTCTPIDCQAKHSVWEVENCD